eukprot:9810408-Alexandrium_andersonii.AAC.1
MAAGPAPGQGTRMPEEPTDECRNHAREAPSGAADATSRALGPLVATSTCADGRAGLRGGAERRRREGEGEERRAHGG